MNQMEIFKNPEFGSIRVIEENGKYLFCGTDVAAALGYSNPRDASQNKGHVQSDQAAAYLFHGRSAYWRTAFLFAQKTYRKQCSGYVYDAGYAALLYAGYHAAI